MSSLVMQRRMLSACAGWWIGEGTCKAGIQRMGGEVLIPLFPCLQRHVVPPIPVLGIPTSLTPGCRSSPSLGKGEQRSGGEGSQSLAIY